MLRPDQSASHLSIETSLKSAFDHVEALTRVDGDTELLAEMAVLFLESHVEQMSALRAAIARRDAHAVKDAAHALKGAISNFVAQEAFDAAQKLETMADKGDLTQAEAAWSALEAALERLNRVLGRLPE